MNKLVTTLVGGTLTGSLARLAGSNPLLRLGAASVAARIAAGSIPLGLVMIGAASAWNRHNKAKAAEKRKAASVRSRTGKPRRSAPRAAPRTAHA